MFSDEVKKPEFAGGVTLQDGSCGGQWRYPRNCLLENGTCEYAIQWTYKGRKVIRLCSTFHYMFPSHARRKPDRSASFSRQNQYYGNSSLQDLITFVISTTHTNLWTGVGFSDDRSMVRKNTFVSFRLLCINYMKEKYVYDVKKDFGACGMRRKYNIETVYSFILYY